MPWMKSCSRQLEPGREQQRGPDDGVEAQDVLADQLPARRPQPRGQILARPRVGERRGVVDERVDPDVDGLIGIPRQRHAPGRASRVIETSRSPPSTYERTSLRRVCGSTKSGRRRRAREQLLEGREAEEVLCSCSRVGTVPCSGSGPVVEVVLAVEVLAGRAVEAGVGALVEVAALADALDEALHERLVLGSVVRMKKSLLAPMLRASSRKRSAIRSAHCLGVEPARGGGLRDRPPCSSVPVRKNASSPRGARGARDVGARSSCTHGRGGARR